MKTYFAGNSVSAAISDLEKAGDFNLYRRAIYDAVQQKLGSIDPRVFSETLSMSLIPPEKRVSLTNEYNAHKLSPENSLSPLLTGIIEITTGALRVKMAMQEASSTHKKSSS